MFGASARSRFASELEVRVPALWPFHNHAITSGTAILNNPSPEDALRPNCCESELVICPCCEPNTIGRNRLTSSAVPPVGPLEAIDDRPDSRFCPVPPPSKPKIWPRKPLSLDALLA